jgi:dTDP-4-amino-4,6-dideoxygalactose transaminase
MIPLFKVFVGATATERVAEVLASGYLGQGEKVEEFEEKLAQRVGTRNVLAVNSGTSALDLALACLEIGPGDEVISTPMTCSATNHAINNTGATIVWADIDPITGLISAESVTRAITEKTRAIVCVDWAGEKVELSLGLLRTGIPLIIDSAHRAPSVDDRSNRGGDVFIAYSFQAIKFLTTGDGGCLITPPHHLERARLQRWFGLDRLSSSDFRCAQSISLRGSKWHMNDIAAAIGLANLEGLYERVVRHQQIVGFYKDKKIPITGSPESHHWVAFLHVKDRPEFQRHMAQRNIATSLVHSRNDRHPVFGSSSTRLPKTDAFDRTYCAIPCGWWLTDAEVEHIAESVLWWKYHTEGAVL